MIAPLLGMALCLFVIERIKRFFEPKQIDYFLRKPSWMYIMNQMHKHNLTIFLCDTWQKYLGYIERLFKIARHLAFPLWPMKKRLTIPRLTSIIRNKKYELVEDNARQYCCHIQLRYGLIIWTEFLFKR
jgi:hypothetical protein